MLESYVPNKRDKKAALRFMKKSLKTTVAHLLSSPMVYDPTPLPCKIWVSKIAGKWGDGTTTGWRVRTFRFDDENV